MYVCTCAHVREYVRGVRVRFLTPSRCLHRLSLLSKAAVPRGRGAWEVRLQPLTDSSRILSPPPPQEFVQLAKRLVSDPALEKEIVANGREYVNTHHSWRVERDTYQHLIRTLEGGTED